MSDILYIHKNTQIPNLLLGNTRELLFWSRTYGEANNKKLASPQFITTTVTLYRSNFSRANGSDQTKRYTEVQAYSIMILHQLIASDNFPLLKSVRVVEQHFYGQFLTPVALKQSREILLSQ